jgi:hypothetical protein
VEVGVGGRVLPADAPSLRHIDRKEVSHADQFLRSLAADRRRDAGSVP